MKALLASVPLLVFAGCAAAPADPDAPAKARPDQNRKMVRTSDCLFHSSITGFNALDNRYIVLYGGARRSAYLVEVTGGCFDVKNQVTLAAVDGDGNGQICGFGRDSIAFRQFGRLEQCRILSIEQLSDLRRYEVLGESPPQAPGKDDEDDEKKEDQGER